MGALEVAIPRSNPKPLCWADASDRAKTKGTKTVYFFIDFDLQLGSRRWPHPKLRLRYLYSNKFLNGILLHMISISLYYVGMLVHKVFMIYIRLLFFVISS